MGYRARTSGIRRRITIQTKQEDGASAITTGAASGTRYSFREHFDTGTVAWTLKRLGKGDELRPIFMTVLTDCMAKR